MKLTETKEGIVINVFVKPNSPRFELAIEGDEIVIHCTNEPIKGKVNKELVKELTKFFHLRVDLVSGATSKQKRLLLRNAKKTEIEQFLGNASL
jgi:uncharacterized protein